MEDGGSKTPSSILDRIQLLQHLKPRLQYCAQEIVNVGLGRVEVDDGDAALDAEVDFFDAGERLEHRAQHGQVIGLEIGDGKYRGFAGHVGNVANVLPLGNRRLRFSVIASLQQCRGRANGPSQRATT